MPVDLSTAIKSLPLSDCTPKLVMAKDAKGPPDIKLLIPIAVPALGVIDVITRLALS